MTFEALLDQVLEWSDCPMRRKAQAAMHQAQSRCQRRSFYLVPMPMGSQHQNLKPQSSSWPPRSPLLAPLHLRDATWRSSMARG